MKLSVLNMSCCQSRHSQRRLFRARLLTFIFLFFIPGFFLYAQEGQTAMWNFNTGRSLEAQNRMGEAVIYYNEAIRIGTDEINRNAASSDSYVAIAWSMRRLLRYRDVLSWGERGLSAFPEEHRLVQLMGEAYFYLNDHNTSLALMQRYVNNVPRGGRASVAYFFIGEIYRFRNQYRHAEIAYTTAVQLDPGTALWWFRLASVREAEGDFREAVEAYEYAIRLNPNYQQAIDGLNRSRNRMN